MADFKTLFGVAGVRAADPPRSAGLRSCCIWRHVDARSHAGRLAVALLERWPHGTGNHDAIFVCQQSRRTVRPVLIE